jgi:alkylhydroperoxidase/carboxymuconolactone decarboxylase family protein YurZ
MGHLSVEYGVGSVLPSGPGMDRSVLCHWSRHLSEGVFTPKFIELLSIDLDASFTHTYAPGTRRKIKAALSLGATMEEITEVLKVCVAQGVCARSLRVPTLAEKLEMLERQTDSD